jgi:hypothetical protein
LLCYNLGVNPEQLKPVLEEMSQHLTDDDKERLRDAFRLRRQEEKGFKKEYDLCFIESLLTMESQRTEGNNQRFKISFLLKLITHGRQVIPIAHITRWVR